MDSSSTEHDTPPDAPIIIVTESTQETPGSTEQTPEPATNYQVHEKAQEPPSPRQESPVVESSIRKIVPYTLRITLEGTQDSELVKDLSVLLHESESYQEIEKVAKRHATALFAHTIGERELKVSYGSCSIASNNRTKFRLPLRSQEDWTVLYNSVDEHSKLHTHERLQLYISRHYLACQDHPTDGNSFAELKCLEIDDLMKKYIPHNILETVISDQTVYWIIKEDPPKSVAQDEQDAFIRRVQTEGRILLAMCVHAQLGTDCLKKLLDRGWKDRGWKDSSLPPLDDKFHCHYQHRQNYRRLCKQQGSFRAAHFVQGEHKTLDPHTVVPLRFCSIAHGNEDLDREIAEVYGNKSQASPREEDTSKKDAWRGSGANSNVYCVKVDPNHHRLSRDLDACFALKEYKDKPNVANKNFDRELAILKELHRYPHPHIVMHLATWIQEERYFILFPYAQCNLRQYMEQTKFDKSNALWLLAQFHGLAGAVKRIHDLSGEKVPTSNLGLTTPTPEVRKTAWHHDLKPENILFFKDSSCGWGVLRIADWGSGKVNIYRTHSYHTHSPITTLTYESPDFTRHGETSRPHDLWSLGCVFLEVLIWAVFGSMDVEIFSNQRNNKRDVSETDSMKDDAFWQKNGDKYVLRDTVVAQLQCLDEALSEPGAPPFKGGLKCVRRMLETENEKRIKAPDLSELLDQIYEAELKNNAKIRPSLIQTNHYPPDGTAYEHSPVSGRDIDPAFADHFNLSPSDMSPHTTRSQHSRNSSASELIPSNATRSRQSSNASTHSNLSLRNRRGSHSSGNPPESSSEGP